MKKIYSLLLVAITLLSFNTTKAQDLIITGAFDGPLSGGIPKLMELYVVNNIADMSIYGVSSVTNGGGTTGAPEFTFPAVAATAGSYIWIATDSTSVFTYFGVYPHYTNNFINVNGDDALELFLSGTVVDVFGTVDCDPNASGTTCPEWDHLDGWGYRNDGETGTATFDHTDWTFSGANATDGCTTNATCASEFPIGTYLPVSTPKMNIESPSFTMNEADPTTVVTRLIIDPAATTSGSYEIHLVGGNGSSADLDLTLFGGGPFPLTLPYSAGNDTLVVPITPNNDAVYEGTETFEFVLRNATGGLLLGADSTFTLTMTDDELPPDTTVSANPNFITANENAGTANLSFDISQLSASSTTFTADVALISGNAAELGNYTTQTVSFTPTGATTQNVSVSITDNAVVDGDRTYIFQLTNLSAGLTLGANEFDTLVIIDNDAPTYTIASLTTVGANGNPDSIGVEVELDVVVMGINYGDAPNVNFYIHDGTGGMGVFNANSFGYTVNEGDQITLRGEVGFFNGLTQLVNLDTIIVTGTGTLPAVATVTALNEATEGELVKLVNVTVVDQSDWNTGVGAGFNVEVTDGTNTYSVRIDKSADLFNVTLPGCVLDITGIGSQFDNSSPYTEGYQLLPRYTADITVISACVTPSYTIAQATEVNTDGDPILNGVDMMLKGIITSPDFRANQNGTEFTFADNTGGIWAYTSDSATAFGFTPTVGDSVVVYGNIGASSGANRIYIDSVALLGVATPYTPTVVSVALAESHEAELIKIENLKLNGTWQSSGGSYNVSATSDNGITYDIRVDADRAELYTVPLTTANKFNLTGVGAQFDATAPRTEGYQIMPRFAADIEILSAIKDITLNNLSISPVPANDILNIAFDYDANETATINVVDVMGRVALTHGVALTNGFNKTELNVANLNAGFYVVQIKTAKGVSTSNITIK